MDWCNWNCTCDSLQRMNVWESIGATSVTMAKKKAIVWIERLSKRRKRRKRKWSIGHLVNVKRCFNKQRTVVRKLLVIGQTAKLKGQKKSGGKWLVMHEHAFKGYVLQKFGQKIL